MTFHDECGDSVGTGKLNFDYNTVVLHCRVWIEDVTVIKYFVEDYSELSVLNSKIGN